MVFGKKSKVPWMQKSVGSFEKSSIFLTNGSELAGSKNPTA